MGMKGTPGQEEEWTLPWKWEKSLQNWFPRGMESSSPCLELQRCPDRQTDCQGGITASSSAAPRLLCPSSSIQAALVSNGLLKWQGSIEFCKSIPSGTPVSETEPAKCSAERSILRAEIHTEISPPCRTNLIPTGTSAPIAIVSRRSTEEWLEAVSRNANLHYQQAVKSFAL